MAVFRVDICSMNAKGQRNFIMLDCPTCEVVGDVYESLRDDKVIYGHALTTDKGSRPGEFEVRGREPVVIGREAVWQISVPKFHYVEYEE